MLLDDSVLLDDIDEEEENPPMIEWMKEYADYAGPRILRPTLEQVKAAIKDDFPELYTSDLDLDHLLEEIGIHIIADLGDYNVAWFGSTDANIVEALLSKFQDEKYSRVRKRLGIDYLWIMNLRPHLGHMRNDAFEALVEFGEMEEKPECVIIDL